MIHIEGMGWHGSILAMHLDARGIGFTWNDTNALYNAWQASTGLCYPAGDARSAADLEVWRRLAANQPGPLQFPPDTVKVVDYTYTQKTPPHGGPKARVSGQVMGRDWSVSSASAVQVDVVPIVRAARARFVDRMTAARPTSAHLLIRAHGFTPERLHRWVWGWNRPVQLALHPKLRAELTHDTTAIYCRQGRFVMAYAYPIPTQPGWWWAGSSLIPQQRPKSLDDRKHFDMWRSRFTELAPFALIEAMAPAVQGWRPQPRPDDSGYPIRQGDTITFPPLWHSGVRWAPSTMASALELL